MRLSWLALIFLTSCTQLQGPYQDPQAEVPCSWKNGVTKEETIDLEAWWEAFNDPMLNALQQQGIENNQTALAAFQRMMQAYYQARFRLGNLAPQLTLNPTYFRQGSSIAGLRPAALAGAQNNLPMQNGVAPAAGALPSTADAQVNRRVMVTNLNLPLNFSWELDLWGKLSQNYLNAYFQYESQNFSWLQALNQLTADIAVNYYLLRGFDSEIEIVDQIIFSRQENLNINKVRYQSGLINYLDVTRAEVDYFAAKADKESLTRQRELQVNLLALLVGAPASNLEIPFSPLAKELPPTIPTEIPSRLLVRRPDILSRLNQLKSAYAAIGVAYAEFFPDLTLSGAVGYASNRLSTLFDWQSRLWQMAASIMQIIYDGGQLKANLHQTAAAYAESVSLYEESVLTAFKEVEDSLVNIKQRHLQEVELVHTVVAAQETYDVAKSRYDAGLINYLEVVIAERDLLNYSRSMAIVHAQRFVDTALLAKSLGGGWESLNPSLNFDNRSKVN